MDAKTANENVDSAYYTDPSSLTNEEYVFLVSKVGGFWRFQTKEPVKVFYNVEEAEDFVKDHPTTVLDMVQLENWF